MSVNKVYIRKPKLTQIGNPMEKEQEEDEPGNCWMPGTPKRKSPVKLQKVHVKRQSRKRTNLEIKAYSLDEKSFVFDPCVGMEQAEKGASLSPASSNMNSSDEKSAVFDPCVEMVGKEKEDAEKGASTQSPMNTWDEKSTHFDPCTATIGKEQNDPGESNYLETRVLIDLNKTVWNLNDDVDSAHMDSEGQVEDLAREKVFLPDQNLLPSFDLPNNTNNSVEIHSAHTADSRDIWQGSMTHNSPGGECFVLPANQFCQRKHNLPPPEHVFSGAEYKLTPDSVVRAGGNVNIAPTWTVLAGPSHEALMPAALDDRQTLQEESTPIASQDQKTRKKPKRKKHRPKVVVDGGPKKNTITPKLATPKKAKEKPSQRRKYVRKTKDKRSDSENFRNGGTISKLVDTNDIKSVDTCSENITIISAQGSNGKNYVSAVLPNEDFNDLLSSNCLQLAEAEQVQTLTASPSRRGELAAKTSKKRSRRRRKLNLFSNLWPSTARKINKKRKVIPYGWRSVNSGRSISRRSKRKPSLQSTSQGPQQLGQRFTVGSGSPGCNNQPLEQRFTEGSGSPECNNQPVEQSFTEGSAECNNLEICSYENLLRSIPICNGPAEECVVDPLKVEVTLFDKVSSSEVNDLNTAPNVVLLDAYSVSPLYTFAAGDWLQANMLGTQQVSRSIQYLPGVIANVSQRFGAAPYGMISYQERVPSQYTFARSTQVSSGIQCLPGVTANGGKGFGAAPYEMISYQERIPSQFTFGRSTQQVSYEADIEVIIRRLQSLHISDQLDKLVKQSKNARGKMDLAVVPLQDQSAHGAVVPYKEQKKKIWPKIDLDSETLRVWNLLMNIGGGKTEECVDEEKKKWWKREREVCQGRVVKFIAQMHLIQGDRGFQKWKGSVVNSVVGVFLTQNVSDFLSSNAFMSLMARFPLSSEACKENMEITCSLESIGSNSDGSQYFVSEPEPERRRNLENFADTLIGMVEESSLIQIEDITSDTSPCHLEDLMSSSQTMPNHEPEVMQSRSIQSKKRKRGRTKNVKEQEEKISTSGESVKENKVNNFDWDALRRTHSTGEPRSRDQMDSVAWEAVRCADVNEIAEAIKDRGQHNIIAGRIKDFLNRLLEQHGTIDLEWLRNIPPDKAKEYLLGIPGLGLKSVECVRLLTLQNVAFPVDTNVGRIAVRLGWVPLQPLPEELQIHLLEQYPLMDSIQKYLWPRLCTLDQETLYELHYQLITFGKVFCTKRSPNCNACPMRGECRHFASAFASTRLALPGPSDKRIVSSAAPTVHNHPILLPKLSESGFKTNNCEPIVEEPNIEEISSPILEAQETEEPEIEYDTDGIPIIKLNIQKFRTNVWNVMDKKLQDGIEARALVALNPIAASIPAPKLKNISRLRSEHQVYELPPGHPILEGFAEKDPDDRYNYHLAIRRPGETPYSMEPPKKRCNSEESDLCDDPRCFSCNNIREQNYNNVRATVLIPCRTALRGNFPLNGTYFQTNEVFADHETSHEPIHVSRDLIYNLKTKTAYFGTSAAAILKGDSTGGIQKCFWKGIVCVRGFDRRTGAPRPLVRRLHCPPSKLVGKGKGESSDE